MIYFQYFNFIFTCSGENLTKLFGKYNCDPFLSYFFRSFLIISSCLNDFLKNESEFKKLYKYSCVFLDIFSTKFFCHLLVSLFSWKTWRGSKVLKKEAYNILQLCFKIKLNQNFLPLFKRKWSCMCQVQRLIENKTTKNDQFFTVSLRKLVKSVIPKLKKIWTQPCLWKMVKSRSYSTTTNLKISTKGYRQKTSMSRNSKVLKYQDLCHVPVSIFVSEKTIKKIHTKGLKNYRKKPS